MVESLHISNYALIDDIDITLAPGLNVITGETGAGKSIIMGALSLILGGRVDSRVVSDTSRKSVIEAVFKVDRYAGVKEFCLDNDLDYPDDSRIIMRREITPAGRSRAFINDTPVTVTKMRELAIHLVDIHSQHQNLLLAQGDFQRDIIDRLAANSELLNEYLNRFTKLKEALRRLKRLKAAIAKSREDEEFTRFQIEKLDNLNPQSGEIDELERERDIQANLSQVKQNVTEVIEALSDSEYGISTLLDKVAANTEALESYIDPKLNLVARLDSIALEIKDITETFQSIDDSVVADADSLEYIETRLSELNSMLRRHKVDTVEELIAIQKKLHNQLELIEDGDEEVATLEKSVRRALSLARESAAKLTASRKTQAADFGNRLQERAIPLGMKNMRCEIRVNNCDLTSHGADNVEFLFAFNKNQPLLPVGNTASGGEISRLMLSIKAIIAEHIQLPSLILDEIDTGVSGDVATRMGELMKSIAGYSQVIVITHLPQVAAKGNHHYKVYKVDDEDATHTRICRLSDDQRVDELALMLSGDPHNEAARANARELLNTSK